jgi:hypothetical protein
MKLPIEIIAILVCASMLCDIHPAMKFSDNEFLTTYPLCFAMHDYIIKLLNLPK